MSNRRLEVFHYRQVLFQMQQGLSDRAIARHGLMGRHKVADLRCRASPEGWTTPGAKLPDNAMLEAFFSTAAHSSKAVYSARRDLCEGCRATGIPIAAINSDFQPDFS